jgi:hypothetical protein
MWLATRSVICFVLEFKTHRTYQMPADMVDNLSFPTDENAAVVSEGGLAAASGRVAELTWALIDERITDEEMAALDRLLSTDENARSEYLRCIQLHADLQASFSEKPSPVGAPPQDKPPVLGSLGAPIPPLDFPAAPPQSVKS